MTELSEVHRDLPEDELWGSYCYITGMSCSGEHDNGCNDPVKGHYAMSWTAGDLVTWPDVTGSLRHWLAEHPDGLTFPESSAWVQSCDALAASNGRTSMYADSKWDEYRAVNPTTLHENSRLLSGKLSPIEQQFWNAYLILSDNKADPRQLDAHYLYGLVPQYHIGRYRVDFALPQHKIGIELDGFATHSSTEDIARDRRRQRALESEGWYIIRFGGREVHHDAFRCVSEAGALVSQRVPVDPWIKANRYPFVPHDPYSRTCPEDPRECRSAVGCGRCTS